MRLNTGYSCVEVLGFLKEWSWQVLGKTDAVVRPLLPSCWMAILDMI